MVKEVCTLRSFGSREKNKKNRNMLPTGLSPTPMGLHGTDFSRVARRDPIVGHGPEPPQTKPSTSDSSSDITYDAITYHDVIYIYNTISYIIF